MDSPPFTAFSAVHTEGFLRKIRDQRTVLWSEDNSLALITEEGILIVKLTAALSLITKKPEVRCVKATISPAKDSYNLLLDGTRSLLKTDIPNDDVQQYMWDRVLSSPVRINEGVNKTQTFGNRYYRSAAWSPASVDSRLRCVIATLTRDLRLAVYMESDQGWQEVHDISALIIKHNASQSFQLQLAQDHVGNELQSQPVKELVRKARGSAIVAVDWSHLLLTEDGISRLYLFAASAAGLVYIIWVSLPVKSRSSFIVENIIETKLKDVSSLRWCARKPNEGILVVGSVEGFCNGYVVDAFGQVKQSIILHSFKDRLRVQNISWNSLGNQICMSKGRFIYVYDVSDAADVQLAAPTIHKLQTRVNPTGISFKDGRAVLSTYDLGLRVIALTSGSEYSLDVPLQCKAKSLQYTGVDFSPSGVFLATLACPHVPDSYQLKHNVQLYVYVTESAENIARRMWENSEQQFWQLSDGATFLGLRLLGLFTWLDDLLAASAQLSDLSTVRLKLVRYLLVLKSGYANDDGLVSRSLEDIERILIERYIYDAMVALASCKGDAIDHASLQAASHGLCDPANEQLPAPSCFVCYSPVTLTLRAGICVDLHKFGRCCQTTELCEDSTCRKCSQCGARALPLAAATTGKQWYAYALTPRCSLCDGILL